LPASRPRAFTNDFVARFSFFAGKVVPKGLPTLASGPLSMSPPVERAL
jgi:hypothetical protein